MLKDKGLAFEDVNYAKQGLAPAVVEAIVKAAGGVARVLNGKHEIAKAKGWQDKPPGVKEFAAAVAREPNLMRRPIWIAGDRVMIGYHRSNAAEWAKLTSA